MYRKNCHYRLFSAAIFKPSRLPFNKLLIITFCVNFAEWRRSSLMIFLYTYVFRYSENKTSFMLLITTLFLLLTTVLAGVIANTGKKQMMIGE